MRIGCISGRHDQDDSGGWDDFLRRIGDRKGKGVDHGNGENVIRRGAAELEGAGRNAGKGKSSAG